MRQVLAVQIPQEQHEQYDKGQHLRGKDAELVEQVRAEMVRHAMVIYFLCQTLPHLCKACIMESSLPEGL